MLDGFDFGVGMLSLFIGRTDAERRTVIETVGPVWNGNEVWFLTAGGATFAAFPTTYALMFSYLYTALLLILFSLILRGVSIEFREQISNPTWRRGWDWGIFLGSVLPALLFGVAFGNIFQGIPMDAAGYHGTILTLLNPYGLLTGIFFVLLFILHGAVYLSIKTGDDLGRRSRKVAGATWYPLLAVAVAFLAYTAFATKLYDNFIGAPLFLVVPLAAVIALLLIKVFLAGGKVIPAFVSSCVTVLAVTFTGIIGLYPNLIPSSIDPVYSLTIFNSSSSPYTLKIMTVVALIFVPIVIVYQAYIYRVFMGKVTSDEGKPEKTY
jgi:cytochrome d ubiquinol oxidase subunit II